MPKLRKRGRRKSLVGWIYTPDSYCFRNIDAWGGYVPAYQCCLLKRKRDGGKFAMRKVRITLTEIK
jgi:hypothetical protein